MQFGYNLNTKTNLLNSEKVFVELPISNLNLTANTDTSLGIVTVPSGYHPVSCDYVPNYTNGGSGWGSLSLHVNAFGVVYGMCQCSIINSSGTIYVECRK